MFIERGVDERRRGIYAVEAPSKNWSIFVQSHENEQSDMGDRDTIAET
jgi:hypothetical protein